MGGDSPNGIWRGAPPAPEAAIEALIGSSPIRFPDSCLEQLRSSDGGEGDLAIEPGWIVLWPADQVAIMNREYQISEWLPGLFGFGSNGGGELLAFDCRDAPPYPIVMVPFVPMELAEAERIANDFDELRKAIGRPLDD